MPKGRTRPELYLAFHLGLKPQDLIKKGLKPATVYNYSRKYKKVREEFEKLMREPDVERNGSTN